MFIFKYGNIWSGGDNGLAVLTNPTEIAFRKGKIKKHYPILYKDKEYADSEALYQWLSRDCKADKDACYRFCKFAIYLKLTQYPKIFTTIEASGGIEFLEQCSHHVNGRSLRWEGSGRESGYIMCLIAAYDYIKHEGGHDE